MDTFLGLFLGIGLSAACGFRVFVPLLGISIASMNGYLDLSPGFDWIGTWPACVAFATATILEIGAYYVPWLDHLLDTIATPAAIIAGSIVTASMLGEISPFLKWSLAIIAGGGTAGIVQTGTVMLRGLSSTATGGLGNFIIATGELIGSILATLLAMIVPAMWVIFVGLLCILIFWRVARPRRRTWS